jgi:hypothetical protein
LGDRWWKAEGWGIYRAFLGASKAPSGYSKFGLRWFWYERDLGVVGPTGVTESSLEAPSSSADVTVCKQNWVWFWGPKFGWATRRLAGGLLSRYIVESMWSFDGRGSGAGSGLYMCVFSL